MIGTRTSFRNSIIPPRRVHDYIFRNKHHHHHHHLQRRNYRRYGYQVPSCISSYTDHRRFLSYSPFSNNNDDDEHLRQNEDQQQRRRLPPVQDPLESALAKLPEGGQIHLDFFGEPVTFLGCDEKQHDDIASAIASLDGFLIGIVSKGKAFTGGGEEMGLNVKAYHSSALAWSELIRHAIAWNNDCPMLTYAAIAPVLAQSGAAYVHHLDRLLQNVDSGVDGSDEPISLIALAEKATSNLNNDDHKMTTREVTHLKALKCLLQNDHRRAMMVLYRHLVVCPGDALALSLLLDICHTLGDTQVALRGSSAVAAYWNERKGGMIRPSIPGYNTVTAAIAVGLAVGGRRSEAEAMAEGVRMKGEKLAGGLSTWALAHVFDAEGRTAEGISACANFDGMIQYEHCGFLMFDACLAGYGVRFALDREERGRGRSPALRLYDTNYEPILDSSGFSRGILHDEPHRRAPIGWHRSKFERSNRAQAFMADVFGKEQRQKYEQEQEEEQQQQQSITVNEKEEKNNDQYNTNEEDGSTFSSSLQTTDWDPSMEDVLTWLPPTPQFLSDATLLLLRFTLNGTISCSNYRWENLRNAWSVFLEINSRYETDNNNKKNGDPKTTNSTSTANISNLEFYPLACVAASLMAEPRLVGELTGAGGRLQAGLHKMGELLNLGNIVAPSSNDDSENTGNDNDNNNYLSTILFKEIVADKEPDFWLPVLEEAKREEWKTVLKLLSSAIDGIYDPTGEDDHDIMKATLTTGFQGWEFDVRPFLEHAVVYAACKCGDYESLSIARSICSRGVTLRPNSPEEWWRYSIVLGLLGDEKASEDALNASHSFGGGQGTRLDS